MKFTEAHFDKLQSECMKTLTKCNVHPFMVQSTAHAWSVFHKAKCYWAYDQGYNDAHIETALKRIFKR